MCGRYQLQLRSEEITNLHARAVWRKGHAEKYEPRSQVRPTNYAPVLVQKSVTDSPSSDTDSHQQGSIVEIAMMRWGFDPVSFGPNNRKGQTIINARSETALQLPSFRGPLCERPESRRCVIPSTGFYEWYKQPGPGKTEREPFLCRLGNNENAMMAGIYDIRTSEQADYTSSFVILTAAASNGFAWLHDRQPCLLSSEDEINGWLDSGKVSPKQAVSGLRIATNIFCTRMLSDLSKESTNQKKPRREGDIKSFFTAKTTSTNNTEVRVDSHSLSKASSSAVRKPISKRRNAAGKTGQSHISSFFSASQRRS